MPNRQRGHVLLAVVAMLALAGLYSLLARLYAAQLRAAQTQDAAAALARAREALLAYAASYGDLHADGVAGYLPCPDTFGDGTEQTPCGTADQPAVGLLPYRTLGLPPLRDADGNCLWYAVAGSFKNSPKSAATPMNWDAQGTLIASVDGTDRAVPDDANGGAAAIVVAPGAALAGQARQPANTVCGADPLAVAAYLESTAPRLVGGEAKNAANELVGNDRLLWLAPSDIFARVAARADFRNPLGSAPEGQIARLLEAGRRALESRLWSDMAVQTAASSGFPAAAQPAAGYAADYGQFAGKLIGEAPDLKPLDYYGASFDKPFDAWRDHLRYVVCDNLKASGCLALGGQNCRGALLFAGQARAEAFPFGGPRPASQKPQAPLRGASLGYYFESGAGLDILAGAVTSFIGPAIYSDAARSADVGICLAGGDYATFAKDIGSVRRVASSATRPEAAVNVATATVSLGNTAATAAGSGCAWLAAPLAFGSSLRAYFRLRFADRGEGLVFAVVDARNNQAALAAGTLCGSITASQLGYSGPAMAPPKFGLELDTRTQASANCTGSNRNDPSASHMAWVFWGTAASTADDNCHNAGTLGSGAEPLNPRALTTAAATVTGAAWIDRIAVVTTAAPHGFADRQTVTLAGIVPGGYNGSVAISPVDATRFAYALAADPGAYVSDGKATATVGIRNVQSSDPHLPYGGSLPLDTDIHVRIDVAKAFDGVAVRAVTWSAAGSALLTTAAPHGLQTGQRVNISGISPAGYDGSVDISVVDATHFSYAVPANPGAYLAGGRVGAPAGIAVQAATWSNHGVTLTTATPHGFVAGQPVSVAGATPAAYNGTRSVVPLNATQLRFALGSDPGAYAGGGSLTPGATLTLKAYVASELNVISGSYIPTCSSDDLRNLSADLAVLCSMNVSIEQEGVAIDADAATGAALASVYAGFTNAQSTGAAGLQSVTVSDLRVFAP